MRLVISSAFFAVLVLFSSIAFAGMDGAWSETASGFDEGGEPIRSPDFFNLYLVSHDGLLCGSYEASGHRGNKIDFSRVFGRRVANKATLYFLNGFTGDRTSFGVATLAVSNRKGKWVVTKEPNGESWVWGTANVAKSNLSVKDRIEFEKVCANHWGRLAGLDFTSDAEVLKFLSEVSQ